MSASGQSREKLPSSDGEKLPLFHGEMLSLIHGEILSHAMERNSHLFMERYSHTLWRETLTFPWRETPADSWRETLTLETSGHLPAIAPNSLYFVDSLNVKRESNQSFFHQSCPLGDSEPVRALPCFSAVSLLESSSEISSPSPTSSSVSSPSPASSPVSPSPRSLSES